MGFYCSSHGGGCPGLAWVAFVGMFIAGGIGPALYVLYDEVLRPSRK